MKFSLKEVEAKGAAKLGPVLSILFPLPLSNSLHSIIDSRYSLSYLG